MKPAVLIVLFGCLCSAGKAQALSPLFARGYTVMPEPQKVVLAAHDILIDQSWRIRIDKSVPADDVAVTTLRNDFVTRFHVRLKQSGESSSVISLRILPGSVQIGHAQDSDRSALEQQAYRMTLQPGAIEITANAPAGLFYGVETLVQSAQPAHGGELRVPQGEIVDWPDVRLREVFWDELRHLDHFDVLEQAVRRAAFFKVNAIALRLNGHFQCASAPGLVDPYALSPAQLQELTNYGLHYHVQIIPIWMALPM